MISAAAGDTVTKRFLVINPVTDTPVDADALPTLVAVYKNGASTADTVTVADVTPDGHYTCQFTVPASGYDAKDVVQCLITADVTDNGTTYTMHEFVLEIQVSA